MDSPKPTAAASIESFFTRQRANEGIELPLDFPDGKPSPHKIRIRGIDSDVFRSATAEKHRRLAEIAATRDMAAVKDYDFESEHLKLLASLVVSWTFDEPCTPENVVKALQEAPQIADQIDRIAARRSLFFRQGSLNSTNSPAQSLS